MTESPAFQQGVKDYREGKVKMISRVRNLFWVKRFIQVKQWNEYYKYNSVYCFLSKEERKGVWIGFAVTNEIPLGCKLCTDEELVLIDDYRKNHNIYPRPLKVVTRGEV